MFFVVFFVLALSPYDRADWALENVLVLGLMIALGISYKRFQFSKASYTLIFSFLMLHEVGAHYTYAKVPYDTFLMTYFNFSFNEYMGWTRNHFDRLVHFSYGLLLAYPAREFYRRVVNVKGFWQYFFPINLVIATSAVFELFEWGAATLFGGDLGIAYLGTQGDVWDAHKDMLLASVGAVIAMGVTLSINMHRQTRLKEG